MYYRVIYRAVYTWIFYKSSPECPYTRSRVLVYSILITLYKCQTQCPQDISCTTTPTQRYAKRFAFNINAHAALWMTIWRKWNYLVAVYTRQIRRNRKKKYIYRRGFWSVTTAIRNYKTKRLRKNKYKYNIRVLTMWLDMLRNQLRSSHYGI